ncbi:MAG: hypothetical protein HY823_07035 [Acidobacteria bacterium]|nr:hypothetical protein [Acidobacteriota bacterium]
MKKLAFLFLPGALLLPDLPIRPFLGPLPPMLVHPLGRDDLGRDALARLVLASTRSAAFAATAALLAVGTALILAASRARGDAARSALRSAPPLLFLIPLAGVTGGLGWALLLPLLALLGALHLEPPLRARLDPFLAGPAWASGRCLGAGPLHQWRSWLPFFRDQGAALLPGAWVGALWGELTLSALGLGPGPERDGLGRILQEQLPRLATDPTPLGWASLGVVLALAWGATTKEAP